MSTPVWIAIAAGLLLVSVAAELVSRWWMRHRSGYYVWTPGMRLRVYPERAVFPQLETEVRFDINRDGERGDEPPRSRAGLYRILVAGGSQPEGYLLDQPSSWPGALQRLLNTPTHLRTLGAECVHVGSIARSGVGSEGLNLILAHTLPQYRHLDAIVILIGASDVLRWLEEGAPSAPPAAVRTADVFRCHPETAFSWRRPRELAIVEVLTRIRRRWLRPVEVHEHAARWIAAARASRANARELRTDVPDPRPMLDHFERHFRELLERATAHADRVLVVRQPWFDKDYSPEEASHMWHGGAGPVWKSQVTTYYSFEVVSRLMRLIDTRATMVADELEIQHLDLMPILEASLKTYYDCFHLTPAGARDVAGAVAAEIVRTPNAGTRILEPDGRTAEPSPAPRFGEAAADWAALQRAD